MGTVHSRNIITYRAQGYKNFLQVLRPHLTYVYRILSDPW